MRVSEAESLVSTHLSAVLTSTSPGLMKIGSVPSLNSDCQIIETALRVSVMKYCSVNHVTAARPRIARNIILEAHFLRSDTQISSAGGGWEVSDFFL